MRLVSRALLVTLTFGLAVACTEDDKKKAKASTKMRSTGAASLNLTTGEDAVRSFLATTHGVTMTANSDVKIESFKVPVSRVNLIVWPTDGGGYKEASPDIYACPHAKDDDCLVDLTQPISIDNLLKGADAKEIEVDGSKSYDGVAVEFCHERNSQAVGMDNSGYDARITASVTLGTTTLYTNKTTGLSTTGPAEEIALPVKNAGCGVSSKLMAPVTLEEGKEVMVVLYADPNGAVFATNDAGAANSSCIGENNQSLCADAVAVFGTVDTVAPKVERYRLANALDHHADTMMAIAFNSSDVPFGAMLRHIYRNSEKSQTLHSSFSFTAIDKNADGTLTFKAMDQTGAQFDVIPSFTRGAHSGKITKFVDSEVSYTATAL